MAYIEINGNIIIENLKRVLDVCKQQSVSLTVVTKVIASYPELVSLLCENGVDSIADANAANFAQPDLLPREQCKRSLIKTTRKYIQSIPGLTPAHRVDRLFISDERLLSAVEKLPRRLRPDTILVAETGDLRDGFDIRNIPIIGSFRSKARVSGLSANFACLSGRMPDDAIVRKIAASATSLSHYLGIPVTVSLGGTVVYKMLESGALSGVATELRMGEGIFFGYDTSSGLPLEGFKQDAFTLYGEIVEIHKKTIEPVENAGHTAFGGAAYPRKTGWRYCAVIDFGLLGASMSDLTPLDPAVEFAGQTYDFTVLDITDSRERYETGGFIPFRAMYAASARAFLNPYIERVMLEDYD